MKILIFTRLEKDTGGDEALLNTLYPSLLKNLSEGTEAHLCLLHDVASEGRAKKIEKKWSENLEAKKLKGKTWLFSSNVKQYLETGVVGQKSSYIELNDNEIKEIGTHLDPSIVI